MTVECPPASLSASLQNPVTDIAEQLLFAVKNNRFKNVSFLLQTHKSDLNVNISLVVIAIQKSNFNIAELLVQRCQSACDLDSENKNLLHHLFEKQEFYNEKHATLFRIALVKGASLLQADHSGMPPLIYLLNKRCDPFPQYRQEAKTYLTTEQLNDVVIQDDPLLIYFVKHLNDFSDDGFKWLLGFQICTYVVGFEYKDALEYLEENSTCKQAQVFASLITHQRKFPNYENDYVVIDTSVKKYSRPLSSSSSHLAAYAPQHYVEATEYNPYLGDPEREEKMKQDADPTQWALIFSRPEPEQPLLSSRAPLNRRKSLSLNDLRETQSPPVFCRKEEVKRNVQKLWQCFEHLRSTIQPKYQSEDELELLKNREPIARGYLPGLTYSKEEKSYIPVRYKPSYHCSSFHLPKEEDKQQRESFIRRASINRRASLSHSDRRGSEMSSGSAISLVATIAPSFPVITESEWLDSSLGSSTSDVSLTELLSRSHHDSTHPPSAFDEETLPLLNTLSAVNRLTNIDKLPHILVPTYAASKSLTADQQILEIIPTLDEIKTTTNDLKEREHVSGTYSDIVNNLSLRFEQYNFAELTPESTVIAFHGLELVGELLAFREAWRELTHNKDITDFLRASTNALAAVSGIASVITETASHFTGCETSKLLHTLSECFTSFSNIQTTFSKLLESFRQLKQSNLIEDIDHGSFDSAKVTSFISKGAAFSKNITFAAKSLASAARKIKEVLMLDVTGLSSTIPILGIVVSVLDIAERLITLGRSITAYCDMAEIKTCLKMDCYDSEVLSELLDKQGKTDNKQLMWTAFKADPMKAEDAITVSDIFDARRYYLVRELKQINQKRAKRDILAISLSCVNIVTDILKLTGVASEVGLTVSAGVTVTKTTQITVRAGKQLMHNILKDEKSLSQKHQERCLQIQIFVELLETVAISAEYEVSDQELHRAQIAELRLLFNAAGMRLESFLKKDVLLENRIKTLYTALKRREGIW